MPPSSVATARLARVVFVTALGLFVASVASLSFGERFAALANLGVPTMQPSFIDAYTISGASMSLAQGHDPLVVNPGDVRARPMNYPRAWLLLAHCGLRPEHATQLALAFVLAFVLGVLTLVPLVRRLRTALLLVAVVTSPVVWLGIERGNNDLFVFGLTAVAAALVVRSTPLAAAAAVLAGVLKLFPALALAGLLGAPRRARLAALVGGVLFLGYVVATCGDLPLIAAGTYHWNRIGYGIDQVAATLARTGSSPTLLLGAAIGTMGLFAVTAAIVRTRVRLGAAADLGAAHALAAFRMGAAIYVGTFCLGDNFDYRLMFLLLVVPQLAIWTAAARPLLRAAAATTLAVLLLLCWSMTWRLHLEPLAGGEGLGLLLDEGLSWALVGALLLGSALVLPDEVLPQRWRGRPFLDGRGETGEVAGIMPTVTAAGPTRRRRLPG